MNTIDPTFVDWIAHGLFFIVGHPRGGTTLLQAMLSAHSRLTVPVETQFFVPGTTHPPELCREIDSLTYPSSPLNDMALSPEKVRNILPLTGHDRRGLFLALLCLHAQRVGKQRSGEKSPYHIHAIPLLRRLFPCAKFICIIRDPRAVVASERATTWGSRSLTRIATRWRRVVLAHMKLQRQLPASTYTLVRYEDLVSQPEPEIRRMCDFLGESFESGMLHPEARAAEERGFAPHEHWKEKTRQPLDDTRISAWRQGLDRHEIALIEKVANGGLATRDIMQKVGYAPSQSQTLRPLDYCFRTVGDRCRGVLHNLLLR